MEQRWENVVQHDTAIYFATEARQTGSQIIDLLYSEFYYYIIVVSNDNTQGMEEIAMASNFGERLVVPEKFEYETFFIDDARWAGRICDFFAIL